MKNIVGTVIARTNTLEIDGLMVVLREAANRLLSQRVELENADYQILTGNRNRCRNLEGDPHEARTLC